MNKKLQYILSKQATSLPAMDIAEKLNHTLKNHNTAVVMAPPGAGKSTLLPLTILQGLSTNGGKILMLEPRRLAAREIATRMAKLIHEEVGRTIGYRVRFESRVSATTRIEVLTEGILTRMLTEDATLDGVSTVIFDEFHERSINTDLTLALARQIQRIIRPDLRLILMSATINSSDICQSLQAPLIESRGKMFHVTIEHTQQEPSLQNMPEFVAQTVRRILQQHEGDILVFLPGQGEIIRCCELLSSLSHNDIAVFPLYGALPFEQQQKAILPSPLGKRKVVLATSIAETSLTIEGVRCVVDAGFCRKPIFDFRTGLSRLETVRISMDMATQRSGRAGRVAKGFCYRLWSPATEHRMEQQRLPEILGTDLTQAVLNVSAFGENDFYGIPWITMPKQAAVSSAYHLLNSLRAINDDGSITPIGKQMAALPCHPRVARMMLGATNKTLKALACDIAALLEEKDPIPESGTDITGRISHLRKVRTMKRTGRWNRIALIAQEYRRMIHTDEDNSDPIAEDVGLLVALAYPERIAMATDSIGHFRLADGSHAMVDQGDWLSGASWLAIASLHATKAGTGRIFLAAPLCPDLLNDDIIKEYDNLSWDNKQGVVVARCERRIGTLVVSSQPLQHVRNEALINVICTAVQKYGLSMLNWDKHVQALQHRVAQVANWHPEMNLANLSTQHLLNTAPSWLPAYLNVNGHIPTSVSELKRIDLTEIMWNAIPYEQQQIINKLAPTHITVPTGSRIRIDYRQGAEAPIVSVRLQECFGLTETPRVDNGHCALLMELLSPGFKPVQLTKDLHHFWQTTYFEIRKELRRRYPKHHWPEHPLEAEAVKGVKRK